MRNKEDLTKRILEEQNKSPAPGDFVELVDFMKTVRNMMIIGRLYYKNKRRIIQKFH